MTRLGVVVGLPSEAICLRRVLWHEPPLIFCAGAAPARIAGGVAELVAAGARKLVSFGLAGGLVPSMASGDILLADRVTSASGETIVVDADLRSRIAECLDRNRIRWHAGAIAGVNAVIATGQAKQELARITAAVAADMESFAVGRAAAGRPFAVLRVIVDPADRAIPASVLVALGPDGRVRPWALIGGLLHRPSDLRSLWSLARDHAAATQSMRRAAAALAGLT